MSNIELYRQTVREFDAVCEMLQKSAFQPTPPPSPPGGDPNAMPPGGDPNAMPPGGDPNAIPPGGDPNAMPPGGDPNAMPPGGAPPPGGGGPISPELEQMLSQMAEGVQGLTQSISQHEQALQQLSQRLLAMEEQQSDTLESLKGPAPYEGDVPQKGVATQGA